MTEFRLPTPEAVDIEYDVAGIGTRFLAAAIDTLIWGALLLAVGIGAVALALSGATSNTVALMVWLTLTFAIAWGYYIVFETLWSGQTPGKRAIKLRVIKTSGYPIGFIDALVRNLVRFVDFLPGLYGIGVVVMFSSRQARRLGDYAAGTIVVKERERVQLRDVTQTAWSTIPRPMTAVPRGAIDPDEDVWDLGVLKPDDLIVILEYLDRAASLRPAVRTHVGLRIARHTSARIHAREPLDPVQFLERVVYLRDHPD